MPLNNSINMKLDRKSFREKGVLNDVFASGVAVVDIKTSPYFQIFHDVCIHAPTTINQTMVKGMKIFHPNRIIWSYLYLGKVARIQINVVTKKHVLRPNQIQPGIQSKLAIGDNHPPKNMITASIEISHILAYSAR